MESDPTTVPFPGASPGPVHVPWEQIISLPWFIQAMAVLSILFIVLQAAPRLLGPWQTAIESWTDGRRRSKVETRDAAVGKLSGQVDQVQSVLEETRKELARTRTDLRQFRAETRWYQQHHDQILGNHAQWDRWATQALIELGASPRERPPLWPTNRLPIPGDGDAQEASTRP